MVRCTLGCPWNWDSLLSYSTVKIVQIQDKRLGLLHYFFMLCILAYIVGFTVMWQMRYLREEAPVGSIRTSLLSPQNRNSSPLPPAENITYCLQSNATKSGFPNYECLFWDEDLVVYPILEPKAIFVTTRVTNTSEELANCSLTHSSCKYVNVSDPNTIYIGDIEDFTLLVDHAMYTSQLGYQANGQDLPGALIDIDGNEVKNFPPGDQVGEVGKQDIMHVSLLLQAAGIDSLDTPGLYNVSLSKRYEGLVLLVFITYSNTFTYNTNKIRYEISIEPVSDTKFKAEQPIYTKSYEKRVIWNRHGIRLLFFTTGTLGRFDFQTLLLTFVSGIGLLAVATLVVDVIAVWLIPGKEVYKKYKYQETPLNQAKGEKEYEILQDEDDPFLINNNNRP